jgi:hypothetical protein
VGNKIYIVVGMDYGSCFYEGDTPELVFEVFYTEEEANTYLKDRRSNYLQIKEIEFHLEKLQG